jgi:hypothetical protein
VAYEDRRFADIDLVHLETLEHAPSLLLPLDAPITSNPRRLRWDVPAPHAALDRQRHGQPGLCPAPPACHHLVGRAGLCRGSTFVPYANAEADVRSHLDCRSSSGYLTGVLGCADALKLERQPDKRVVGVSSSTSAPLTRMSVCPRR